jgi:hypothetical protein
MEQLERSLRQAESRYQLMVNPALNLGERAIVDYGGSVNFAAMAIDDVDQSTHILRQTDGQLWALADFDGAHQFYGRLRFTYRDFNDGDSFDGKGDEFLSPVGDRYWYRFDLRRAIEGSEGIRPDYNVTLQVGRQFVDWATGLALSEQLYAVRAEVELGSLAFEGLASMTPASSVIDFDSSRPDYDDDTERAFFGGRIAYNGIDGHQPYVYFLNQQDNNDRDFAVFTVDAGGGLTVNIPTRFNYDSSYIGVGSTGTLLPRLNYMAEFIYQYGQGLSSSLSPTGVAPVAQTEEDIEAWAARAGLVYLLRDENQSRLEVEVIAASGDEDRRLDTSNTFGGNQSGTNDNAFNGFGFARTGLAFAAPISNILIVRAGGSTFPLRSHISARDLQVGIDLLWFNKVESDGPIDEPTDDDAYLGFEPDLFVNWRILSDVVLNFRYGVFIPGDAIQADHQARHFVYTGITYAF